MTTIHPRCPHCGGPGTRRPGGFGYCDAEVERLQADGHMDAELRYTDAFFAECEWWTRADLPNGEVAAFSAHDDAPIHIWLCPGCWTMILDESACPGCETPETSAWIPRREP